MCRKIVSELLPCGNFSEDDIEELRSGACFGVDEPTCDFICVDCPIFEEWDICADCPVSNDEVYELM